MHSFPCDTDTINQGDELEIAVSDLTGKLVVENKTKRTRSPLQHDLT